MKWIDENHSIELKTKKCYQNGWRLLKATKLSKMKLDEITNRDGELVSFPEWAVKRKPGSPNPSPDGGYGKGR